MAPLLIDSRDLLKLGSILVLVIVMVFAGGFFMGHQRAAAFYQAGSEMQSLSLPEKTLLAENVLESQRPEVIVAGEYIDVDQPETVALANEASQNSMSDLVSKKPASKLQSVPLTSSAKENRQVNEKAVSRIEASVVNSFTSGDLSKIKYSVQVGMYGRLLNAENMMKMLQAQQYDAYVSDYTNKKNEIRYNVRFGYFADKKSALARLKKFKADQQGDGYLVKFSATNIVNVADVVNIESAGDMSVQKNKVDKVRVPTITPLEAVEDKISQTDLSRTDLSQVEMLSKQHIITN